MVDLLLTDPPYNVDVEETAGKILNDNLNDHDYYNLLMGAFSAAAEVLKEGGAFYIWHAEQETINNYKACKNTLGEVRERIIWVKNAFTLGRQDYQWQHEPCLYGWKDGAAHYFVDDRTNSTVIEDKGIDPKKMSKAELVDYVLKIREDKISTTVIHEDKPSNNKDHPTMKPISLLARLIKNSTRQGEKVLDVFGGSGSTLIACEQLNRICYTMELDPRYADVIIQRWEQYTGGTAELLED